MTKLVHIKTRALEERKELHEKYLELYQVILMRMLILALFILCTLVVSGLRSRVVRELGLH